MCNRLFVWAHAYLYSQMHHLPLHVNGWYKTQLGPWIRKERTKRFYALYFRNQTDLIGYTFRSLLGKNGIKYNPPIHESYLEPHYHTVIFNKLPHSSRYFSELKGHSELIRDALINMIVSRIQIKINHQHPPEIGIHVRRGDFIKGSFIESLDFFKKAILFLRSTYSPKLNAIIFSDGYNYELQELLNMPDTTLYKGETDIEDLIVLSRSKFIVTSLTSTFSYWAVFLSDAVALYNPLYDGQPIRWEQLKRESDFLIESPPVTWKKNV